MKKALSLLLFAVLALVGLGSCGDDEPDVNNRKVNATAQSLVHVLNGQDGTGSMASGETRITINRGTMTTELTTTFTIGGEAQQVSLQGLATTADTERGTFTFTAASASAGGHTITGLTGTYNYYLDMITVSYTVDGRYQVNATPSEFSYTFTTTESKCDTDTFTYYNILYTIAIDPATMKASLKLGAVRLNDKLGQIEHLDYEGLNVTVNGNGYEIAATNCPTVTDIKSPLNYMLNSAKAQVYVANGSFSGTFSLPGYTLTASGTETKPEDK